jgi:hypothetical protein
MIQVKMDTSGVSKLEKAMGRYSKIFPNDKANSVFRRAVRPMLAATKVEAPVSMGGRMRISLRHRNKGSVVNAYAQGGATRRDLRIKTVPAKGDELGRVLVGVSKAGGKVGWRTHFITRGTKERRKRSGASTGRMTPNNFLQRSFDRTISGVRTDFERAYREAFVQWAKTTLPQGTV